MIWFGATLMLASLIIFAWLLGFIPGPSLPAHFKEGDLDELLIVPFLMFCFGFALTFGGFLA